MKKITKFLLIIMMIFINIGLVKAEGLNIKLESITVKEKSSTITVEDPVISGDDVTSNITFNEKDDYVIFTLTFKNNESEKYKITSLEDNNESSKLGIEYTFSDEYIEAGETGTVDIKITYKELLINQESLSLDNLSVTVNLEKGDSSTSTIVINPITGDSIIHYVLILVVSIVGICLIVFKKKKVGSVLVVASILLIPVTTFALIKFNFQFKFTGIKIIGQFENYNISISVGDSSEPTIRNITYGQPIGELPTAAIKEGHTFSKWVDQNNNEVTSETIITGSISISPVYTKNSYNVTVNNSQNVSEGNISGSYEYGSVITLTAIAREGYTFTNWSNGSTDNPLVLVVGASDIEIEPIYTIKTATFKTGKEVNSTMKELANSYDKVICYIKKSTYEPDIDQMTDANIVSTDDSEYPIYMWYDKHTIYWWSEAEIAYLNEDSSEMFSNLYLLIFDASQFDTSKVVNMYGMFSFSYGLTELDLSMWDTSNVTNMSFMFGGGSKSGYKMGLVTINLKNWNTSNVTDMSAMFNYNINLSKLDLTSFDTSNVTDMSFMFARCESLVDLDISSFNTSNVANMNSIFMGLHLLESLDISHFDTSNVVYMQDMFSGMNSLESLDLSNFDTNNVINMYSMFSFMTNIKTIYASDNFVTSSVDTYYYDTMFESDPNIIGGMGTRFCSNCDSTGFAHIDEGIRNPGYFTCKDKIILTFDPNGGSVNIESTYINKGKPIGLLASPIRRGYRFIGWYTETEEGDLITTESIINDEIIVYAHWEEEPNQPLISYSDVNPDGIVSSGDYVTIGDEDFLVISSGNGSIKLLARYNLDANYRQSENNYVTMPFANVEYWTNAYNAASSSYGEASDINNYYLKEDSDINNYYYIYRNKNNYNTPNNLVSYINNYKTHLIDDLGISNIKDVRLVKSSELDKISCFEGYSINENFCDKWVINQNYWLGSIHESFSSLLNIAINKECGNYGCLYYYYFDSFPDDEYGVRALVEIPYNLIDVKYVIDFDSQGGNEIDPIIILNNYNYDVIKKLPTPVRENYIFGGWYTDTNYETKVDKNYIINKDIKLYAKWLNTVANAVVDDIVVDKNSTAAIVVNNVDEEHTFKSNNTYIATVDSNGVVTGIKDGTTTITITGNTSRKTKNVNVTVNKIYYTITLDPNGGTVNKESVKVEVGSSIGSGTLPKATQNGVSFAGWYTEVDGGEEITSDTVPTENITYYAHWGELNKYVINDLDNDGTISTGDMITLGDDEFYVLSTGNNIIKLLTKYNLDENYRQSENFVTTTYSEINYWFNEAASSSSSSSASGGAIANNFNYNSYGMPYIYRDKDNKDTDNNIKVYVNNYKEHLIYDIGINGIVDARLADFSELVIGNCNEWATCTDNYNHEPILLFDHNFWLGSSHETFYADHDTINYYDASTAKGTTGNAVYNSEYPEYQLGIKPLVELSTSVIEYKYIVEFESDGGTEYNPIVFLNSNNNPTISTLPTPTKHGYDFMGWYKDSGFNTKVEDGVSITEDTKLYAKWEPSLIVYTDSDNSGYLDLGDLIKIGNEEFYYIGEDGDNAKLITKYGLGSDSKQDPSNSFELAYSNDSYWSGEEGYLASDYAEDLEGYGYIYRKADGSDTDNNYKTYINNYKDYLINTLGASDVLDVRMLSYVDAYETGCMYNEPNSCPDFMFDYYFNIGSTFTSNYSDGMLWWIVDGELLIADDGLQYLRDTIIRPLIVIPKSVIIK